LPIAAQRSGPSSRTSASFPVENGGRPHAERRGHVCERPEGVGGEQVRLERLAQTAQLVRDAVDQPAAVGEGAVHVEQEMLELERRAARDRDRPHVGPDPELPRGRPERAA
jgi:hypothetical protein